MTTKHTEFLSEISSSFWNIIPTQATFTLDTPINIEDYIRNPNPRLLYQSYARVEKTSLCLRIFWLNQKERKREKKTESIVSFVFSFFCKTFSIRKALKMWFTSWVTNGCKCGLSHSCHILIPKTTVPQHGFVHYMYFEMKRQNSYLEF